MRLTNALAMSCLVTACGCNGGYEGLIPLEGRVTFDGSAPPAAGVVQFVAIEPAAGRPHRTATGQFDMDGHYEVSSFKPGDGIYPGKYHVTVICNKPDLDYSKKDPFREASYIADDFEGKEFVVEEDEGDLTLDLDVPLKKR